MHLGSFPIVHSSHFEFMAILQEVSHFSPVNLLFIHFSPSPLHIPLIVHLPSGQLSHG